MPINPDAVGAQAGPVTYEWSSKDCLLYAVGVGSGLDELAFTTENSEGVTQRVLPSFAVIAGGGAPVMRSAGDIDMTKLVHGEQAFEVFGPIPTDGKVSSTSRITGIFDKGKGAVIETETVSVDAATGAPRFNTRSSVFIRGAGGFGGERGSSASGPAIPESPPDHVVSYATRIDQALIYRLSGDRNPLHSDPSFAHRAGFPEPILHGLCTYGFTGRALLHALCASDPARFRSMAGRFTSPVLPGEELAIHIWATGDGQAVFRTKVAADDRVVIDQGLVTFAP
jgi:acyl dehydratase